MTTVMTMAKHTLESPLDRVQEDIEARKRRDKIRQGWDKLNVPVFDPKAYKTVAKNEHHSVTEFRKWFDVKLHEALDLPEGELLFTPYTFTPEASEFVLRALNFENRSMVKRSIIMYIKQIEEGRWRYMHQGIAFSRDGWLNDGQNRLAACYISKVPIKIPVCFGENRSDRDVVDTGKVRTASDVLALRQIKCSSTVAATARLLIYYFQDGLNTRPKTTNEEIAEFVEANEDIIHTASIAKPLANKLGTAPSSVCMGLYLIAKEIDPSGPAMRKFEEFLEKLTNGGGERDHCLALRDGLMNRDRPFTRDLTDSATASFAIVGAIIRAWNAFQRDLHLKGKRLTDRLIVSGWKPGQAFPQVEISSEYKASI